MLKIISSNPLSAVKYTNSNDITGIIYASNEQPLFFKSHDLPFLIPTCYAFWTEVSMLPHMYTHAGVMKKLFDGAGKKILLIPYITFSQI